MEAKNKTSQVPSSGSSRIPDGGLLRTESFGQRPDHPVSKTGIEPSSVNAAMLLDILPRAAGPTSSVFAVAAWGTLLVKLTSPLDGDPKSVELKTSPELCVLVYVGPELRSKSQDNHQCMTVVSENEEYLSDLPRSDQLRLEVDCPDNNDRDDPPEFRLGPSKRYARSVEVSPDAPIRSSGALVASFQTRMVLGRTSSWSVSGMTNLRIASRSSADPSPRVR
ncbi:unnamed protein product [Phytophthora fragariaefolia]|uniref:Unnamed protein product n=1 Tax=Phytophthora fragariaefolia TaxID=1490495 RepID=A0A9W6WYW1_9STRA|nr:unnamed protein product [Phytophthora fragariaefolia]